MALFANVQFPDWRERFFFVNELCLVGAQLLVRLE